MKEISVAELKAKMDANESFQLIDVREPWERNIADIGGKSIPMGEILNRSEEIDPNTPCIIHCRTGGRSGNVVSALEMHKHLTNLYNLKGGIIAWAEEIDKTMEKY